MALGFSPISASALAGPGDAPVPLVADPRFIVGADQARKWAIGASSARTFATGADIRRTFTDQR